MTTWPGRWVFSRATLHRRKQDDEQLQEILEAGRHRPQTVHQKDAMEGRARGQYRHSHLVGQAGTGPAGTR